MTQYKRYIRKVPDFPKPGILFRDITPLLLKPEAFHALVEDMALKVKKLDFDLIVGIESRGFLLGSALAYKLHKGMVLVRKPGKLPSETVTESYALEYGEDSLEMHKGAVGKKNRVLLVDDVIATGGTARATVNLIEKQGATVAGCLFLIELKALGGLDRLGHYPCITLVKY